MDLEQVRTFLAVVETGSFVGAAEKVYVTQSTVSSRIRTLEQQIGKSLFERSKRGAALTPAGEQFHKHALSLLRIWQQARLEVSLPAGYHAALSVGGTYSLWDRFLMDWLHGLRELAPGVALRAQLGFSDQLMHRLVEGTLDLGVMYAPQGVAGLDVELLFEDELVLVSSAAEAPPEPGPDYVYVDWGPEFRADHALNFPDLNTPSLYLELGALALSYILQHAASAYFPARVVRPHIADGRLQRVRGAPVFTYPVYAVFPATPVESALATALASLREHAAGAAS